MASSVTLRHGSVYPANVPITPAWQGRWKVNRDAAITLMKDLECIWQSAGGWYYLQIE